MFAWGDRLRLIAVSTAVRIGVALLAVAGATLLRFGLEQINPAILGLGPYYLAVLVAALLAGWIAGGLAAVAGGLLFWFVFGRTPFRFTLPPPELAIDLAIFLAVSFSVVVLVAANDRQKALVRESAPTTLSPRFWAALAAAILGGLALTAIAAGQVYEHGKALARSEFNRLAENHARQLQARLSERETVARIVATLFVAPPAPAPNALSSVRESFFALAPDFAAVGWTPRIEPRDIPAALDVLAQEGVADPAILGPDRRPLDTRRLTRPLYPILDIEPRAPNAAVLGVDIAASPARLAALEATKLGDLPVATVPVKLIQEPALRGVVLFTAVRSANRPDHASGFIGATFRFDRLFALAFEGAAFVVRDEGAREADREMYRSSEAALDGPPWRSEPIDFGQREWQVSYTPTSDLFGPARTSAWTTATIGLGATAAMTGLLLYVLINFGRLQNEVAARTSAEKVLQTLISELNHRVKNMLAVVQSIILRSLRPGMTVEQVREVLMGRLHAMAHAVSMLSDSGWTEVRLRALLSPGVIPFSDRIEVTGPDIMVEQRDGQAMALLFYELATNAAKHGALSAPGGKVRLHWELVEEKPDAPLFQMRWEENGGPVLTPPSTKGFGSTLIGRIAPETLGGKCEMQFSPAGFVYTLEAPGKNFKLAGSGPPQELTRYLQPGQEQVSPSP
jgi:two-component sensor histidine kinase